MENSLNQTPAGERTRIAFFGRRNAGKSSLINAFTGQNRAIVSPVGGTTTDPVYQAMELLPLGPVQLIDTAGFDDEQDDLGRLRVERTREVLGKTDLALVVIPAAEEPTAEDKRFLDELRVRSIPFLILRSKAELLLAVPADTQNTLYVSAATGYGIETLKNRAAALAARPENEQPLVSDLLSPGDCAVLVVPIDSAAPKGRLILPQQQVIRDALEAGASALVCRDTELTATLQKLAQPPRMVITDSQVFGKVAPLVPESVTLTSFSILMARYKGDLPLEVQGAAALAGLKDGDKVLIAEGCTHHRQCEDIGTVKIPRLIRKWSGAEPEFVFSSGGSFPDDLSGFKLVVHCGACMLGRRETLTRLHRAREQGIPVVNYGVALAHMNGILRRTLAPFPTLRKLLDAPQE